MFYRTGVTTPVFGLRREIDRLFDDTFGRGEGMSTWSPAVDVRETDNEMRLDVEVPHPLVEIGHALDHRNAEIEARFGDDALRFSELQDQSRFAEVHGERRGIKADRQDDDGADGEN